MNDTDHPSSDQPSQDASSGDGPQPARLKVMPLVKQTYATVFGNFRDMVKIVWVAMALGGVYSIYQTRILWGAGGGQQTIFTISGSTMNFQLGGSFWGIVETLVVLLIFAAVSVALLRYVLAGQMPSFPGFGIGKRELRYWGYEIAYIVFIGLVGMVPFAAMAVLDMGITMALGSTGAMFSILQLAASIGWIIFVIVISVRLAFVFPALAGDREGGVNVRFGHAWETAKGHTATMIGALIVASLPWVIVSVGLGLLLADEVAAQMVQGQMPLGLLVGITVVDGILTWPQLVLIMVMFAHAYATVEALPQNAEESPSALDEA